MIEVQWTLALYWLQIQKRKEEKKRNRMYWIHPIDRSEKGLFVTLYADLRANPDKFFLFARMNIPSFDELMSNPIYTKLMLHLPNPKFPV